MTIWQYFGILGTVWLAPVPTGSWTSNTVIGAACILASIYYAAKGDDK